MPTPSPSARAVAKAAAIRLPPRLSGAAAFEQVARACLKHADANEPLLDVHGDHEAVHQFRVAYRRLRSLFSLCRQVAGSDPEAARLKAGLRELTVAFGPARDLDVFAEAHPQLGPADTARLAAARDTAYAAGLQFLHSQHWRDMRRDLDRWLARKSLREVLPTSTWSGRAMAATALSRRRHRILRNGADLSALDPHERHQVRIEAKKVRYGAQFFGSHWPARAAAVKRMEQLLGSLQDELGELNDAVTWGAIVTDLGLVDAMPPDVDVPARLAAAGLLIDELAQDTPFWQPARPAAARPA